MGKVKSKNVKINKIQKLLILVIKSDLIYTHSTNEFDLLADLLHEVSSDLRRAKFATVFTFLFTGDFGLLRRFM